MATGAMVPAAGEVVRQSVEGTQVERRAETASSVLAEQAKAHIVARTMVAMQRPRDMDDVRVRLLKECKRPGFAQVAQYRKPVGRSSVVGPSIRFAEAALRVMGNVVNETITVYDDSEKRIVRVSVVDLEANTTHEKEIVIDKTVERRSLKDGQTALRTRLNSYGDLVYVVQATDDDMLNKENALVSKALRNAALRILPGDILEECMAQVRNTAKDEAAKDPDTERKRIADAFAEVGIPPSELKQYLGHDLASASPAEIVDLRQVYTSVRDGDAAWRDVLSAKAAERGEESAPSTQSGTARVRERVQARRSPAGGVVEPDDLEPGSDG